MLRSLCSGKNYFLLCLILFILLPKVSSFDLTLLPLSTLILSYLFFGRKKFSISTSIFLCLIFLLITVLFSAFLNSNLSIEHVFKPIRLILVISMLLFCFQNTTLKISINDIFRVIFGAALINAVVIYGQYVAHLFFGINDLLLINFDVDRSTPYRKPGLASGFPTAGLLNVFGVLSLLYLVENESKKYTYFFIFLLPIFFITARTSLVLAVFSITILAFYNRNIFKLVLVAVGIVSFFIMYIISGDNSEYLMKSFSFALELFSNFTSGDGLQTQSTNSLLSKHFEIPVDIFILLFGTSLSTWSYGGGQSDVFFIRVLWGTGVFSVILYVFLYCQMWVSCVNCVGSKFNKMVLFLMFLIVFIASFKGAYIFSRFVSDPLLILFCYTMSNCYQKNSLQ